MMEEPMEDSDEEVIEISDSEVEDSDEEIIEISDSEEEDLESMLMEGIVDEITVLEITMEEIKKKRKIKKKFGNDKLVCKDGVTNLLQFLNEKLSIRAAEPQEQTAKTFNGRKLEK